MADSTNETIRYEWLKERTFKQTDLERIQSLLSQLSEHAPRLTVDAFEKIVRFDGTDIVVAVDETDLAQPTIVGMATLIHEPKLSGSTGRVEDLVIDEAYRGRGIAREMLKILIERAKELGFRHLDWTSRPSREAANKLYVSMGCERVETNVYRMPL